MHKFKGIIPTGSEESYGGTNEQIGGFNPQKLMGQKRNQRRKGIQIQSERDDDKY